jgi:hypothetical protein
VKTSAAFDRSRNRFGGLLLLHRSDNASYRDEPYGAKVEYYRGQNLLAASLHPTTHTRNPAFSRFLRNTSLRLSCDRTQRTSTTRRSSPAKVYWRWFPAGSGAGNA